MNFSDCTQDDVEALAAQLADRVVAPQVIFLWGSLGVGKSVFARAFLRAYFHNPDLAVPSPTFTLVQTYAAPGSPAEVWHADLYRLTTPEECEELGLEEAFAQHICLVEWPDRWQGLRPQHLWNLFFDIQPDGLRKITGEGL